MTPELVPLDALVGEWTTEGTHPMFPDTVVAGHRTSGRGGVGAAPGCDRGAAPYARNPRRGDLGAIKDSLSRHGQYRPIVVNRRSGEVLAGNHVWAAARELGWARIAVCYVDVDAEQGKRIVLVDNRSSDLAGYDAAALAELLQELPELDGTGYDERALSELLDELLPAALPGADELVPAAPSRPRSRPGEL